ncbi:helix-turn-helix domain-containing protein [Ruminococcaceae bacterium OttesenSCG-928-L11]|nr:helix-turn-helix domain-containing protein [Ruminococcaceae bacterium OttesenSCG-928-L11]
MNRFTWFKGKTAKRYLLSYILVSMIPIIAISGLFWRENKNHLSREQESLMLARMDEMKTEMDQNISVMQANTLHFYSMVSGLDADLLAPRPQASDINTKIMAQLRTYGDNFAFPCEIVYYPRFGPDVYTRQGRVSYNQFQGSKAYGEELDMVQFFTKLNSVTAPTMTTTRLAIENTPGTQFVYMSPIPPLDINPIGTIAFIADRDSFNSLAVKYCGDFSGYFFVFNSFYDVSYGLDRYDQYDIDEVGRTLSYLKGTGIIRHRINGESFVTVRAISPGHGLTYVYSIPYSEFIHPVNEQINMYLYLIILLLLVVLGIAIVLAFRNYKPLYSLASDLFMMEGVRDTDVIELIGSQYRTIVTEQDHLLDKMQRQNEYNRQKALESLLRGKYADQDEMNRAFEGLDIELAERSVFVAAVSYDGADSVRSVMETLGAIGFSHAKAYILELDDPGLVVLLMAADSDARRDTVAARIYDALAGSGLTRVTVGVGTRYDNPLRADMSYCEAMAALKEPAGSISVFQALEPTGGDYLCPPSQGAMFRQALSHGNADMASEILERMAGTVRSHHPSFSQARCFCFYIVNSILQIRASLGIGDEADELIRAAAHSDIGEFVRTARTEVADICLRVGEAQQQTEKRNVSAIMEYIRRNFKSYDLSTEQVAREFNLSESHVRRILKDQTGYGLTAYVTGLRLDFIKEKLRETDIPVRDIITQVGYADVSSFTRKFKAAEGITPGQYRNLNQHTDVRDAAGSYAGNKR